jgi:hypothetical protein
MNYNAVYMYLSVIQLYSQELCPLWSESISIFFSNRFLIFNIRKKTIHRKHFPLQLVTYVGTESYKNDIANIKSKPLIILYNSQPYRTRLA